MIYRHDERLHALDDRLRRLEKDIQELRGQISRVQWWLVAMLGGITSTLVAVLFDILTRGK